MNELARQPAAQISVDGHRDRGLVGEPADRGGQRRRADPARPAWLPGRIARAGTSIRAMSRSRPKGEPAELHTRDFPDPDLGKAIPYGVYDIAANVGWVNVGTDHDTAAFAVGSPRRWWHVAARPPTRSLQDAVPGVEWRFREGHVQRAALVDRNAIIETGELVEQYCANAVVTRPLQADNPAATR